MHNVSLALIPCSGSVFIGDWEKSAKREPVTLTNLQVSLQHHEIQDHLPDLSTSGQQSFKG